MPIAWTTPLQDAAGKRPALDGDRDGPLAVALVGLDAVRHDVRPLDLFLERADPLRHVDDVAAQMDDLGVFACRRGRTLGGFLLDGAGRVTLKNSAGEQLLGDGLVGGSWKCSPAPSTQRPSRSSVGSSGGEK